MTPGDGASPRRVPPVVGLGASAGGLRAFEAFFDAVSADAGLAYVLVQHLDPHHESELAELLQTRTSLPVAQIEADTRIEPDRVYIIPPGARLTVAGGTLRLETRGRERGRQTVIDDFFRTLAEDLGAEAAALVLSGTGSDGSEGVRAIRERGGLVLAQAPEEAEYDGMPRSALATGCVDEVLPVADMPERLAAWRDAEPGAAADRDEVDPETLAKILGHVRDATGHDFAPYKPSTVQRRIARRVQAQGLPGAEAYLARLGEEPGEVQALFRELLIGVTGFFRDPEAFAALEREALPALFEARAAEEPLRVWVPGCSTGEEAYSIAMLLHERAAREGRPLRVQIFATDIDAAGLAVARRGAYPAAIADVLGKERLERHFRREGDDWVVRDELREGILFTEHNLIRDPPFSRLDLIACRNLLIYLHASVQREVYRLFQYALRPGGFLFLGTSESTGTASGLFREVDRKHRLYRRGPAGAGPPSLPLAPRSAPRAARTAGGGTPRDEDDGFGGLARRLLLERFAPPCVLVDERYDVVYFSGRTGRFLQPAEGEPSRNVVTMARDGLELELRAALFRAFHHDAPTLARRVTVQADHGPAEVALSVQRLEEPAALRPYALVVFEELEPAEAAAPDGAPGDDHDTDLVRELEQELDRTRESLQLTIEELETSNEELRASNEELQSLNEEQQSTAEELETSKEELQSANEELMTVNQELERKIEELEHVNDDLENLIAGTDIATLFLDAELRLVRFTPAATGILHLLPTDVGRPVAHVSHRLGELDLADQAAAVRAGGATEERAATADDGRAYVVRALPYRTRAGRVEGVVIALVDVTAIREAQHAAAQRARQQAVVAALGQRALAGAAPQELMEEAVTEVAGVLAVDFTKVLELLPGGEALRLRAGVGWREGLVGEATVGTGDDSQAGHTLRSEAPVIVEDLATEARFSGPALLTEHGVVSGVSVVIGEARRPFGVLGVHTATPRRFSQEDVDFVQAVANVLAQAVRRAAAEARLREANEELERRIEARTRALQHEKEFNEALVHSSLDGILAFNPQLRFTAWNPAMERIAGLPATQVLGEVASEVFPFLEEIGELSFFHAALRGEAGISRDRPFRIPESGRQGLFEAHYAPLRDLDGAIIGGIAVVRDNTDRRQTEDRLMASESRFAAIFRSSPAAIAIIGRDDGRIVELNDAFSAITGYPREEALGRTTVELGLVPDEVRRAGLERLEDGTIPLHEVSCRTKSGESRDLLAAAEVIELDGEPMILGMFQDITDRKRYEAELRRSEERFRAVFEQGPGAICMLLVREGVIVDANDRCLEVLGHEAAALTGRELRGLEPFDDAARRSLAALLDDDAPDRTVEIAARVADEARLLRVTHSRIAVGEERVDLLSLVDLTERHRVERELTEARRRLAEAREQERLTLARELHDDAIQRLLTVGNALAEAEKATRPGVDADELKDDIHAQREAVLELVRRLRRTIGGLRPPGLEELGLAAALESHVEALREAHPDGPRLELAIDLDAAPLPDDVARGLYRAAQEALRNALRHAGAEAVRIELAAEDGEARLEVRDDGRGFEVPERLSRLVQDDHFGLVGVEERVELLGGSLSIEAAPGRGTALVVRLPLIGEAG